MIGSPEDPGAVRVVVITGSAVRNATRGPLSACAAVKVAIAAPIGTERAFASPGRDQGCAVIHCDTTASRTASGVFSWRA
jgi:hypothetical protein